ncbi:unnamed protein product [Sphenostylis stenocarpa]|uniref:Uncharacterized protein n=1 Tax=Sphenostylis stenocarpa TaxID=92480 RepID=A0AA86W1G5_9FABA|nr:unnamed protein product [Sphenostylis stenocarpa]
MEANGDMMTERLLNEENGVAEATPTEAAKKLDHILIQNLISLDDEVIEIVQNVRDGFLILSNFNSTTGEWSQQRETVWLQEIKDICDHTVAVADKFIDRRERRRSFWEVLNPYSQHAMEMSLMKEMELISTQFGDAVYRRWTFGDGGKIVMGDMLGSRSKPLTFTCLPLFVFSWRSLDQNLNTTRRYLTLMRAFLSDIDSTEGLILNERQKEWLKQLRVVARKGNSLFDAHPKDRGFHFLPKIIRFARDINFLLNEILHISHRRNIYGIESIQGRAEELESGDGNLSEIIVHPRDNNYGTEENSHAPPNSFSYQNMTELERELELIRGEKQLMEALFRDEQDIGSEKLDKRSKVWVDQMRDAAREIDGVIAEYGPTVNNILEYQARLNILDTINKIRHKIQDASRSIKAYGLLQRQSRTELLWTIQILRPETQKFHVKEQRIVGFDEDAKVVMVQLLSNEKVRCISSIVGIKGTGKTALAKLIFRNQSVIDHFDCRIWISVSPTLCTLEQLRDKIAEQAAKLIIRHQPEKWTTIDVLKTLESKKHLIVFDGVETLHVLDTLRETIPDGSTASRFLLTTRSAIVAQSAGARLSFVHPLRLLDDENSWILFARKLRVNIYSEPKLQEIEGKIVTKCGGLPGEIIKMSTLLSRKPATEDEWSRVEKRENFWSEALVTVNTNLPSYLRRCLFCFELFPADFEIPVRRLIVLWVAEGLVHVGEDQDESPEQVAERYLTELINHNIVQIAKRKSDGEIKTCRLPSVLQKFLLTKAQESSSQVHPSTELNAVTNSSRTRHVADRLNEKDTWHKYIHGNARNDSTSLVTKFKGVLSFMSFDDREGRKPGKELYKFLNRCISSRCLLLLRVLDLEGVHKPKLPENIKKLTRLRYLGLRWTYLESLPSFISTLQKLQTLDLKHTYIHTLTSSIWKTELRHLFLSETYRTRFPTKPRGVGDSLSDLQTLWGLFVDEETPVKGGLDKLVDIKRLGIACQPMSPQPEEVMESKLQAVADWITKLGYLQSLRLKSRDENGRPWNINLNSLENHINLYDMYLLGCLSSQSILSQFPPSLVELTLSHSKLKDDPMQILKDLPNLRSLSLLAESYTGKVFYFVSDSFPQLRVLKVWKLEQLDYWSINRKALPSLRKLEIRSCPRLTKLPFGLWRVISLLELKVTDMAMEIYTHRIPPNCKVHRHFSQHYRESIILPRELQSVNSTL